MTRFTYLSITLTHLELLLDMTHISLLLIPSVYKPVDTIMFCR
jgi:hypothetical protein